MSSTGNSMKPWIVFALIIGASLYLNLTGDGTDWIQESDAGLFVIFVVCMVIGLLMQGIGRKYIEGRPRLPGGRTPEREKFEDEENKIW